MELWFDATADGASGDVRELTGKVNYFMQPQRSAEDQDPKWIAPGIRVVWGTFLFDGIMDSLNEKLEYFSEDGKPLRSQLSLSISNQIIQFAFGQQSSGSLIGQSSPVLLPRQGAVRPDSIQQMAVAMPGGPAWQSLAAANGIENPRSVAPGSLIDPNIASQPGRASANFGIDIASLTGR